MKALSFLDAILIHALWDSSARTNVGDPVPSECAVSIWKSPKSAASLEGDLYSIDQNGSGCQISKTESDR
jgi:hypothetical protein